MKKNNPFPTNIISGSRLIIFGIALLSLVALFLWKNVFLSSKENFKNKIIPAAIKKVLGAQKTTVTINNIIDTNGVYQFDLTLGEGANAKKYTSYISKDGKLLFTTGIKLDSLDSKNTTPTTTAKKLTCNDVTKTTTPKLTAFIVADCPYGLQMQRVMKKAVGELGDLSQYLDVKYIGSVNNGQITSMHGDKEAQENLKQICIREEQVDKYWPYVSCYMQEGKSDECNNTAGVDTVSLQSCIEDGKRGLAYAQKDFDLANKYSIGSSPTLLNNDKQIISEFDFGGRTANSLKDIICCASQNKPGFCGNDLSKEEAAISFSINDTSSGTEGAAANCGT